MNEPDIKPWGIMPYYVFHSSDLTPTEKILLGIVFGLSGGTGVCEDTDAEIAALLNDPEYPDGMAVWAALDSLYRRGWLVAYSRPEEEGWRGLSVVKPEAEDGR